MITADGKTRIKRFFAGMEDSVADSIGVGIGNDASITGLLDFELTHTDITLISYDFVEDQVVFKTSLPPDLDAQIYEVALLGNVNDDSGSDMLTTFDSDDEVWSAGTFDATYARIGADALVLAPTASATLEATQNVYLDLSSNGGADQFQIAFNSLDANTSAVKFRFYTDSSNYYEYNVTPISIGYNIFKINKNAGTVTGSPAWNNITQIGVLATAGAGGAARVDFDGLRIQSDIIASAEYILIAREVLSTPYAKVAGRSQDIEYYMPVSFV